MGQKTVDWSARKIFELEAIVHNGKMILMYPFSPQKPIATTTSIIRLKAWNDERLHIYTLAFKNFGHQPATTRGIHIHIDLRAEALIKAAEPLIKVPKLLISENWWYGWEPRRSPATIPPNKIPYFFPCLGDPLTVVDGKLVRVRFHFRLWSHLRLRANHRKTRCASKRRKANDWLLANEIINKTRNKTTENLRQSIFF